jgi:hypothetical protein
MLDIFEFACGICEAAKELAYWRLTLSICIGGTVGFLGWHNLSNEKVASFFAVGTLALGVIAGWIWQSSHDDHRAA